MFCWIWFFCNTWQGLYFVFFVTQEGKKQFDKSTTKFCASLDRYLSLKTKVPDNTFKEVSSSVGTTFKSFNLSLNPIALRMAKPLWSFDHSECNRVKVPNIRIVDLANSVDPNEVAHTEPPHLDLHCLPSCILFLYLVHPSSQAKSTKSICSLQCSR